MYFVESNKQTDNIVLMIDEVQEIKEFQKALRHFYTKENFDIYCTGSNAMIGYNIADISKLLENIVFIHLKIAGYDVTVGKDRDKEIDFIARKNGELLYFQVAYILENQATIDREFGNLLKMKNNYPKFVISMDSTSSATYNGIQHLNVIDFCKKVFK